MYDLTKPCPKIKNDIELTDEIKNYVLNNRIWKPVVEPSNDQDISLTLMITKLETMLRQKDACIKNKDYEIQQKNALIDRLRLQCGRPMKETFYQKILEIMFQGTHQVVKSGTTDITTSTMHIEIKQAKMYKHALGQLDCYNADEPREELRLYVFGDVSSKLWGDIVFHTSRKKIGAYYIQHYGDIIKILNMVDNVVDVVMKVIYTRDIEVKVIKHGEGITVCCPKHFDPYDDGVDNIDVLL